MSHCPGCRGVHIPPGAMQPFPPCPGHGCEACKAKDAEIAALHAATRRLVEALTFYADPCSYMTWTNRPEIVMAVVKDTGQRAKSALADPVIVALRRERCRP